MHISPFISDLALILISASITTILFKWLKQPVVLGYIVAGFLVSKQITFTPTVSTTIDIGIWSDIGVVFLLFALGLEFSFKKLLHVGRTALTASLVIIFSMIVLGFLIGQILGWGISNSIMLGGMISMSSTTIIIKAFDDLNLRSQKFTRLVFGILIFEDLMAILLMVIISTTAVSKSFEGGELIMAICKLAFFLVTWLVFGIFFIPTLLKKAKKVLNDETMLIVSLGLCLSMVLFAVKVGFSSALGAFVMGSILAETLEAEKIEHLIKPVKDLFGAIFFVSVGMMLDFEILREYTFPIILISLAVICGQIFFGTCGLLLSGQSLKVAIQSGFSLTQIGEFAFIIALLGTNLKLIGSFLYPVIVAVSVITIFLTPFLIKLAIPTYNYLDKHLPPQWKLFIEKYTVSTETIHTENVWRRLLIQIARIILIYSSLVIAILILAVHYFIPFVTEQIEGWIGSTIGAGITILLISPLLRALVAKKNHSKEYKYLWSTRKFNRAPLVALTLLRFLLAISFICFVLLNTFHAAIGIIFIIASVLIFLMMLSRRLKMQSISIERRFLHNLNSREYELSRQTAQKDEIFNKRKLANHLLAYDLHLADFDISANSRCSGKKLKSLNFRKKFGVHIVSIIRGDFRINIPGGEEQLFPTDKILVLGSDEQLKLFEDEIKPLQGDGIIQTKENEISMEQFEINKDSHLIGKSILESGIRDNSKCLVVGIERESTAMMNPEVSTIFQKGDIVWIVGEKDKINNLIQSKSIQVVNAQ